MTFILNKFNMPTAKISREGKSTTYKEIAAIKFNSKEQRCLTKNLQLLGVENKYSLNLINLGSRDLRKYYGSLKDRVSKIKSHLTAEDIAELKQLDEEGKLKGIYTSVCPNLYARINAEAKRLKLDIYPTSRPKTAIPVSSGQSFNEKDDASRRGKVVRKIRPQSEKVSLLHRETINNSLNGKSECSIDDLKSRPTTAHPKLGLDMECNVKPKASIKRSTPVNFRKKYVSKKEVSTDSEHCHSNETSDMAKMGKPSMQKIKKSKSMIEQRNKGTNANMMNVKDEYKTKPLTRENLERQNAELKVRRVQSMVHTSEMKKRTITAGSNHSRMSDKPQSMTVRMPQMAFVEDVSESEDSPKSTPRNNPKACEESPKSKCNSHSHKSVQNGARHSGGRIARQDFVDHITPDSLVYDSYEKTDSNSKQNKSFIEVSKGKMKIATTKTFTAEDVELMNKKKSSKHEKNETENLTIESVRSKSTALSVTPRSFIDESANSEYSANNTINTTSNKSSLTTKEENVKSKSSQEKTVSPTVKHHFRKFRLASTFENSTAQLTETEQRSKSSKLPRRSATVGRGNRERKLSLSASFNSPTKSRFSSHADVEKNAQDGTNEGNRPLEKGRTPHLQDALHDQLGTSIHEEIRRDLLTKENEVTAMVQTKLSGFLQRLDTYIKSNKDNNDTVKVEKNVYCF